MIVRGWIFKRGKIGTPRARRRVYKSVAGRRVMLSQKKRRVIEQPVTGLRQSCKELGIHGCAGARREDLESAMTCALGTVPQITMACKSKGINGFSGLSKSELIPKCCSIKTTTRRTAPPKQKQVAIVPSHPKPKPVIPSLDLNRVREDLDHYHPGESDMDHHAEIDKNCATREFRGLGEWINDEEDYYEYSSDCENDDDEEDCMSEDEYFEDNDQRIWAPGEEKHYKEHFERWAKDHDWYPLVKLSVDTSEKDWAEFSICKK